MPRASHAVLTRLLPCVLPGLSAPTVSFAAVSAPCYAELACVFKDSQGQETLARIKTSPLSVYLDLRHQRPRHREVRLDPLVAPRPRVLTPDH